MGMDPKTKADCDKAIARAQSNLATVKMRLAQCTTDAGKRSEKIQVENYKGEIARLKALRKTLK